MTSSEPRYIPHTRSTKCARVPRHFVTLIGAPHEGPNNLTPASLDRRHLESICHVTARSVEETGSVQL